MSEITTKAYKLSPREKMTALASKFATKKDQVKGADTPAVKDNLVTRMGVDTRNEISEGEHIQIDVQPDFRPIFMCLMFYATTWYPSFEHRAHAKLSPATFVFYLGSIIYAHFLICDIYLRPSMSRHANEFIREPTRRDYLQTLLALPVPDFMVKFLHALMPCSDPRRPLIDFVPSLAAYSTHHDIFRMPPLWIFARAHTYAASVKQNEDPNTLLDNFIKIAVTTNTWRTFKIGQWFGAGITDANDSVYPDTKFWQSFVGMFNPAVFRSLAQKNIYSRIPLTPLDIESSDFNPYIFFLNCDDEHISEMSTLLESVSQAVSPDLKFSGVLGNQYDTISGLDLLRHGYSTVALPTWWMNDQLGMKSSGIAKTESLSARAKRLKFLQTHLFSKKTDLKYPDDAKTIEPLLYLVSKSTKKEEHWPSKYDYVTFDPKYNAYPRVRILDPYDYNPATFHLPIMTGMVIESFEISGFTVPNPSFLNTLDEENSQILQSAVPLSHVRRLMTYDPATDPIEVIKRQENESQGQAVQLTLYRVDQNMLPDFDQQVGDTQPSSGLYGFDRILNVDLFRRAFNKLGWLTKTLDNKDSDETEPNLPSGMIVGWSPYRYLTTSKSSHRSHGTYMLFSLRTVYGTNVTLSEVRNFQDTIPIA
jgi:hypothetical protein